MRRKKDGFEAGRELLRKQGIVFDGKRFISTGRKPVDVSKMYDKKKSRKKPYSFV